MQCVCAWTPGNVHYSSRKFRERVRTVILVRILCVYNSSSNTITWSKTNVYGTQIFPTSGFLSADTGRIKRKYSDLKNILENVRRRIEFSSLNGTIDYKLVNFSWDRNLCSINMQSQVEIDHLKLLKNILT